MDGGDHRHDRHLPVIFSDSDSWSKTQLYSSSSSSSSFIHVSSATSSCPSSSGSSRGREAPPTDRSKRLPSEWTSLQAKAEVRSRGTSGSHRGRSPGGP